MLGPYDYDQKAIHHPVTRALMQKIQFQHGGTEYDTRYPEGIPTSVVITDDVGQVHDSGLIMFPTGHARNTAANLKKLLNHKFMLLGSLGVADPEALVKRLERLERKSAKDIAELYNFNIRFSGERFE
jgi:2-methylcitrate dehydratase